jgi:hypothetical protein
MLSVGPVAVPSGRGRSGGVASCSTISGTGSKFLHGARAATHGHCAVRAALLLAVVLNGRHLSGAKADFDIWLFPGGQPVAALQFDIEFQNQVPVLSITPGFAVSGTGKAVFSADQRPGSVRILIAGVNQDALSSGAIATVSIGWDRGTGPAVYPIEVRNVAAADPSGNAVPVDSDTGPRLSVLASDGCVATVNPVV